MNYKNMGFIVGVILIVLLSVSVASAEENVTKSEIISIDDNDENLEVIEEIVTGNDLEDDGQSEDYNFKIIAPSKYEDYYGYDQYMDCAKPITIKLKPLKESLENCFIDFPISVYLEYSTGDLQVEDLNDYGKVKFYPESLSAGRHTCTVYLDDGYSMSLDDDDYDLTAKQVTINFNIKKAPVLLYAGKIHTSPNKYFKLTAEVINSQHHIAVDEGVVKFKINGKSYSAKVKNGVATKKIKLSKAKTYKYTATFTCNNYYSKTVSSNVVVHNLKKSYTIKVEGYSCKISNNDYQKIIKATESGKFSKKYYTGKTIGYKVYQTKKVVSTKKKLYSYGSYNTYYKNNPDAFNAPSGYTYAGREHKEVNGIEKTYIVYKKTSYKKTLISTKQAEVYIIIDSTPRWGATAKLYHKECVYYDKNGGVETKYYMGKDKQIF